MTAGTDTATETCLRCGAAMAWRHGTWQCPRCRFKLGCCEGDDVHACGTPLLRCSPSRRGA